MIYNLVEGVGRGMVEKPLKSWSCNALAMLCAAIVCAICALGDFKAHAQNSTPPAPGQIGPAMELSSRIPMNVSEVITGGSWSTPEASGIYRAIVVYDLAPDRRADVVLQWLEIDDDATLPRLVASAPLQLPEGMDTSSIFVAFDIGNQDETMLMVGTYDFQSDQETLRFAKLGAPMAYEFVDARVQD